MSDRDAYPNDTRALANLMAFGSAQGDLWKPEELAAILRHQLDAPLVFDFDSLDPALGQQVRGIELGDVPPIRTFRDLLHHANPPVELLELTKRFAKQCAGRDNAPLPEAIATLLYTLSICVGLTRCGCRITEMDDRQLRERIDWALAQPWIDQTTSNRLNECLQSLDTAAVASVSLETSDLFPPDEIDTGDRLPDMSGMHGSLGQLGEYTLLETLGEGGMGKVYKALHTELERFVAIKVIRRGCMDDDWALARFRREIKTVGQLDHPHIVRAYDARRIGDTHFLVMEYVDGLNLNVLVDRCGPLPMADACELLRQAALGLQCAHEHGLVHRDIKPSNLMLNRKGQLKILDLGLVRVRVAGGQGGDMTSVGQVMGTPDYMAPEQVADSSAIDIRADIYSLGCTLYKLLTGHAPFEGPQYQSLLAKMTAHNETPPPSCRQHRDDVPVALDAVLNRMLTKAPDQRFATPAEVADALSRFTQGSDLHALLAEAEGQLARPRNTSDQAIAGDVWPASAGASAEQRQSPQQMLGAKRRRLLPWAVAAGLIIFLVAGRIVWLTARAREQASQPVAIETVQPVANAVVQQSKPVALPSPADLPGWIVLSWTRPRQGKPNLWLFRPDGKRRVKITNDPRAFDVHPKFSPDGRQIAFIRGGTLTEPNSLCVCNADGSNFRAVVTPRDKSERFASPVWLSNSLIYYARDPRFDLDPNMEIWQVDLHDGAPQRVFRLQDVVGKGDGLVTDVASDGRLAIIAQNGRSPATSDIYITNRDGKGLETVWVDSPDEWKDARPLWSPDGARLAWHHNFTRGLLGKPSYYGVAMARREASGDWNAEFQADKEVHVTPLAWSPRGSFLLCARLRDTGDRLSPATLYLMDEHLQSATVLFELEACHWQPAQRDLARLADWAIVPEDMVIRAEP